MEELFRAFEEHFEIAVASSEEEVREVQRLRYQVYCIEHPFEDPEECQGGLETDEYDPHSSHGFLRHRRSGDVAATVRLVRAKPGQLDKPFPIEEHCGGAFYPDFEPTILPRGHVAEISRFAVSKAFRKRRGEEASTHGLTEGAADYHVLEQERRLLPHLTLGLFRAIVRMSRDDDITHWYAVMEPFLIRSLRRFGIVFPPIGSVVEYHGRRQPCMGLADDVLTGVHENRPEVWRFITDDGKLWPLGWKAVAGGG